MAGITAIYTFLSRVRTAMLTYDIDIAIPSVRPSVCLSRSGIVPIQLNMSYFLQRCIRYSPIILVFTILNIFAKFQRGFTDRASNTGRIYKFRDFLSNLPRSGSN